jgi:hypothetical protein
MKSILTTKFLGLALPLFCSQLDAADWLMLQGSEPETVVVKDVSVPNSNKAPILWGFIQVNYKQDRGDEQISPTGINQTPFSLLNPDLEDQSGFNVFRARLALRGMADDENLVNYFFMTEFGNNAINNLAGHREVATYFTDASVTLKYLPYAKLRVGMFKTPGSEEGLQAVFVSPYIEFTTMTNQQLLERQVTEVGIAQTGAAAGGALTVHYTSTTVDQPIAAFRDTGAQIFDTVPLTDTWSVSYAYMYGNGTGISMDASNNQETHYGYLALENNFNEKRGYFHESMKFYGWIQDGERTLLSNDGVTTTEVNANRQRYGVGMTYYHNGLRFEAEYMKAKGMIYTGAKDADADPLAEDWQFQYAVADENTADGGYLNLQYEIFPKKFELFGRYDIMDRLPNDEKAERKYKTATLGCSYRFKGATRIDFNYAFRDAKAPGNSGAQKVLDNMGDRVSVQLTAAF